MGTDNDGALAVGLRLTGVELRKLIITRSTRVFLIVLASMGTVAAATAALVGAPTVVSGATVFAVLGLVFTIAMPVLGVLIFTSDWQHREIVALFLAQPRRGRSFVAKVVATVVVSLALLAGTAVAAAAMSAAVGLALNRPLSWAGLDEAAVMLVSGSLIGVLAGAALGAALQNAIAAISLSFVQSLVLDPLLGLLSPQVGPFLMTSSITDFAIGAGDVGTFATSALVWLAVPFAVGYLRHRFGDVT